MELPLPDYDQLPLNELRHRIRALDEGQLRRLFEHEEAHGNRIPVLELLHARLRELTHGAMATLSPLFRWQTVSR